MEKKVLQEADENVTVSSMLMSPSKGKKANPATLQGATSSSENTKMFLNQFIYCFTNYDVMSEIVYRELRERGIILSPQMTQNEPEYGKVRESNEVSFHEDRAMYTVQNLVMSGEGLDTT